MADYFEIDDIDEIVRLFGLLSRSLRRSFKYRQHRTISYPSGFFEAPVFFIQPKGPNTFWWSPGSTESSSLVNFFGHGDPESKAWLYIDVQINFPREKFERRHAGAFVRHQTTGEVVLAHRAIVTRGNSRVKKEDFLAEASVTVAPVATAIGKQEMILVSPIDSDELVQNLWVFGQEVRRAADAVMNQAKQGPKQRNSSGKDSDPINQQLRDYFDEFGGQKTIPARRVATADCQHGPVVKALREQMAKHGRCLKSTGMDLVFDGDGDIVLFEVKTSSDPQSIYTAVGQLFVHSIVLKRLYKQRGIRKVIVGPHQPRLKLLDALRDTLEIGYLQYSRNADGSVHFADLRRLTPVS